VRAGRTEGKALIWTRPVSERAEVTVTAKLVGGIVLRDTLIVAGYIDGPVHFLYLERKEDN